MKLKRNTIVVIILAVFFIALSSGLTLLAIMADENSKADRVEKIVLENGNDINLKNTSDGNGKEATTKNNDENLSDSDKTASENSQSGVELKNNNITVEGDADDSDCNISYEQAVSLGLKAIEEETGIDCSAATVRIRRYDTNENVTWNCVAETGEHRFEFRVNANSGKILSSNQYELESGSDYVWVLKSNGDTIEKKIDQQKINAFQSLTIEAAGNMNVEVQKGEFYSINAKYYGSENQVAYEIEDGTLRIEADGYSDSESNTLTLTIPEAVTLEEVNVGLDYGNFTLEKVSADTIDISLECGTLIMNKATSVSSTIYIGTGGAELTDYISNTNTIDISAGNLVMENCISEACKINLDMGDAKLKGKLTGRTECTAAMGSVEIRCTGKAKDYNYLLEADLGKISVDGIDSMTRLSSSNNADNSINVRTNMGIASLDFE